MPNPLEMMINQAEIPGVSVARISGDDITTETAGVINADTHEAVSDTTVFEAASLSKPVFAYIVLKMAERGEIDLDRPLHEYFSDRYTLALMSKLPEGNHELAEVGKIYLNEGNYVIRDPNGKVQQGKLDEKIDLSDLANRLNDPKLKNNILDLASKRGHTDGFGPLEMREQENYKKLTARMVLSHQAGLPNEFDPDHGVPFAYVSAVGKNFDYSGEAFRFLLEVVEKIKNPLNLEDLARKEFAEIGMRHSSFSPPTGCSLIRLADDEPPPTPEGLGKLLNSQVSIICAGNKLYVAEKKNGGGITITEKNPGATVDEIAQFESMKTTIKSLPFTPFSRPAEARDLQLVTAIIGHRPKDCTASLAIGHLDKGEANPKQRFYGVHPAGSLYTTAEDYAKFLRTCARDPYIRKEMFTPVGPHTLADRDTKAMGAGVSREVLDQISWGVGIGLQKTPDGKYVAFHWGGDNQTGCNFAAYNPETEKAVVIITNSNQGPRVFTEVAEPVVGDVRAISQWLSHREGLSFDYHGSLLSSSRTAVNDLQEAIDLPKKTHAEANSSEATKKYRDNLREVRQTKPGYLEPTESSKAKEREKYSPFQTTPKPPWKP